MDADVQVWKKTRQYTPEKLDLARLVLEEVRAGRAVADDQTLSLPGKVHLLPD